MKQHMSILVRALSLLLFSSLFFSMFSIASAQIVPGLQNTLVLTVTPTYPRPQEIVLVTVDSFSIDVQRAAISWFVNDTLQQQRDGGVRFQFTAPPLGESAKIDVVAQIGSTVTETAQVIIRPVSAELLWQAHAYAPPFYLGKKLPSVGSDVSVEAIPHFIEEDGRQLRTDELLYTWYVDGTLLKEVSGKGRSAVIVSQTKPVQTLSVEALIESSDKSLSHRARVIIPMRSPEVLVYENSPLLGILFHTAVEDSYQLTTQETKFIAFPFFMSLSNRNDSHILYSWMLDNEPIALGDDRGGITVNHSGEGSGVVKITTTVNNVRDIFQRDSAEFSIEFGEENSSGFGL